MAHVDLEKRAPGLVGRLAQWYSRRTFGQVVEPATAVVLDVIDGLVSGVRVVSNPDKLKRLSPNRRWSQN